MLTEIEKNELKEKFEDFLQSNHENNLNYKRTNYDKFEAHYPESIILEAETSGSKGGNCWGNHSHRYTKDSDEISSDLASSLKYRLESFLTEIEEYGVVVAEKMWLSHLDKLTEHCPHNEVGDYSYGEYYGNYTEYGFFAINIRAVLEPILNEDQLEIFDEVLNKFTNNQNEKQEIEKQLQAKSDLIKKLEEEYKTLNSKIDNHTTERNEFKSQLELKIKQAEKLLENFNEDTNKAEKSLIKQKEALYEKLQELGVDVSNTSKPKVK